MKRLTPVIAAIRQVPGRLLSETVPTDAAGRYGATFDFSQPAEGIDLMVGPWIIRERTLPRPNNAPVRLRTYFFRDLDATPGLADSYLEDTGRYLERYSQQIGTLFCRRAAGRTSFALTNPPSRWRLATAAPRSTTIRGSLQE